MLYSLSIIIPIYNADKYLKECLDSVINDFKDIEYILIDDGSTDNSHLIYNKYKYNDNVKIMRKPNTGVSQTRNLGLNIATGKYIMFVDADDILKEGWYNIVINEINEENDIVIFSGKYKDKKYNVLELKKACLNCGRSDLKECKIMTPYSKIYRREFLSQNNIVFDEDIINGEDMLFNIQALTMSEKVKIVRKSIYIYRINIYSATNIFNKKILDSDYKFQNKLLEVLKNDKDIKKLINDIYFCEINGIYVVCERLSFSDLKSKGEILKGFIGKELYKKALLNLYEVKEYFTKFQIIIINNIIKKRFKTVFMMFKIKRLIKKMICCNKEILKFIEI